MTGEAETSSVTQGTHTQAPPLTDVSPASVLKLTRITEDYLCPPQARYEINGFKIKINFFRQIFMVSTSRVSRYVTLTPT